MKRERRQPTRAEWAAITSTRPVVRRIPPEELRHETQPGTSEARSRTLAANFMEGDTLDVARTEMVEAELDHMIRRRDDKRRQTEGERLEEQLYMPSVRAYEHRLQRERLWERLRYHDGQVRRLSVTLEALIARHRSEVERCEEMLGISESEATQKGAA